jgi:hypothetical protein
LGIRYWVSILPSASRLRDKKKKMARKDAKPQRPPAVKPSAPQFLCVSASLREEKRIRRGGRILHGGLKDAKQGRRKGFFVAAESLYVKKSPLPP